ncbi:MAG: hypothetical protein U9N61_02525 [Euryarchaeota archaeon]|nr:hypothetical protein [Euryarchaeota archaeon]
MKHDDFSILVCKRNEVSKETLDFKSAVYSSDEDRLSNFKSTGAMKNETPQKALWGMVAKHIIAIQDMIDSGETPTPKWVDEYLGDAHNYLFLLEAIWREMEEDFVS